MCHPFIKAVPALALLLVSLHLPTGFVAAQNLQQPFLDCQVEGSLTVYDYQTKRWTYSHPKDAKRATLPASTFKIMNSLIALEENVVRDEFEVFPWDGTTRSIPAWNADTDMARAFQNSTVWFYVELAQRLGLKKYQHYLRRSHYGNNRFTHAQGPDFWNYGDFAVSPKEQVQFLVKLYEGKLPFAPENLEKVKQMMITETHGDYVVRAKTGLTSKDDTTLGWWVGYVEHQGKVHFFATRLRKQASVSNPSYAECRKTITRQLLRQLQILPAI